MKTTKFFLMAALALTLAACSSDDRSALPLDPVKNDILNPAQTAKGEGIPFTATISIDNGATTRAITENGTTLETSWAEGDKVALIHNSVSDEMTVSSVSGGVATITGTITGSPSGGDDVTIIYPSNAADGTTGNVKADLLYAQDGTLTGTGGTSIEEKYDVRKGTGTLNASGTSLSGTVSLTNQFAIFKFTVKNSDASATIDVKPLTITIGAQDYVITPSSATSTLYAVLPAVSSQTVSFSASGSDNKAYTCSKDGVTFAAAKYYQSTLKMAEISGALGGLFSVSASKKAFFSKGNLQATYDGATWTWAFAANQYDYIGNAAANTSINGNGTVSANGTVDLFGWVGANSSFAGTAQYGISNSTAISEYGNTGGESLKTDWGNLAITNGGNAANSGWRTLTRDEWTYLFDTRESGSTVFGTENGRYAQATINTDGTGVNGVILFPDGVTITADKVSTAGTVNGSSAYATKCTTAQWTALESRGCVFLPAAGHRNGSSVTGAGSDGRYWSGKAYVTNDAYNVTFNSGKLNPEDNHYCYLGYSVRLVRPAE